MNKIMLSCLTAATVALAVTPSVAADLRMATKAPVMAPMVPAPNWNGFYIGAMGGYGWGDLRTDTAFRGSFRDSLEGGFVGGTIGYNFQAPGSIWVFGIEGEGAAADIQTDIPGFRARIDAFGSIRGRVGIAAGNVLFYATGGYALANLEERDFFGTTQSQTHDGYAVGGGIEYAFNPNWSLKAEYLYMDFDRKGYFGTDRVRFDTSTVKGGINYHFNFGGPALAGGY